MFIKRLVYLLLIISFPNCVLANVGVPIIFYSYPYMILGLLVVILIEYMYLSDKLDLDKKQLFKTTLKANVISTIIGYPIAWFLYLIGIEFPLMGLIYLIENFAIKNNINFLLTIANSETVQGIAYAAYLGPQASHLSTNIAILMLLIPAFFVSYYLEYITMKSDIKLDKVENLQYLVKRANIYSYIFLAGIVLLIILFDLQEPIMHFIYDKF